MFVRIFQWIMKHKNSDRLVAYVSTNQLGGEMSVQLITVREKINTISVANTVSIECYENRWN